MMVVCIFSFLTLRYSVCIAMLTTDS